MHRSFLAICAASLLATAGIASADGYGRGIYDGSPGSAAMMDAVATMGPKTVGGASMFPSRDIIDNAVHSRDHTTLVAAVKAAGLVDTLKMPGPFTVFAPTNDAFAQLAR